MSYTLETPLKSANLNYCYTRPFSLIDAYIQLYRPAINATRELTEFTISKVRENKLASSNFKSGFDFIYLGGASLKQLKKFGAMICSRLKRELTFLGYLPNQLLEDDSNYRGWGSSNDWLTISGVPNTHYIRRYLRLINYYLLKENIGFSVHIREIHDPTGISTKLRITCIKHIINSVVTLDNGKRLLGLYRMFLFIPQILQVTNTLIRKAVLEE